MHTTKKYLQKIQEREILIENKKDQIQRLHNSCYGLPGLDYSATKVTTGSEACASFEKKIDAVLDAEKRLAELTIEIISEQQEAIDQIQNLSNVLYSDLLYRRYVKGETLQEIAKSLYYSDEYIRKLHAKALDAFMNEYPEIK